MRYERKYKVERLERAALEQMILVHPVAFEKAFPDRQINNVYWDTLNWDNAQDSLNGVSMRTKIRVRWYGAIENLIKNPVLEIKSRSNQLGGKTLEPLPDCTWQELQTLVGERLQLWFPDKTYQAALVNTYQRAYYRSMDGRFRLTLDGEMLYGPCLPWHFATPFEDTGMVVELKYNAQEDAAADEIAAHLALRMTKHSKYTRGVSLVCNTAVY
ncbi:MAG: VTC domain-containing protein [Saprospiraceae bacterium]